MLNEYVYCPRLFYYEHVQGIFTPNADTAQGDSLHARVEMLALEPYQDSMTPSPSPTRRKKKSTVLTCINNRIITDKDFVRAGQAVNLTSAGRKRFFQTYEQRMGAVINHPLFDYKVSYRRALELQARLLAKTLTGEIPEYVPLLTR